MIKTDLEILKDILEGNRKEICCVYGEPATGKTTLAKAFKAQYNDQSRMFDLEDPDHCQAFLQPKLVLDNFLYSQYFRNEFQLLICIDS